MDKGIQGLKVTNKPTDAFLFGRRNTECGKRKRTSGGWREREKGDGYQDDTTGRAIERQRGIVLAGRFWLFTAARGGLLQGKVVVD